jgi:hypothetical protein
VGNVAMTQEQTRQMDQVLGDVRGERERQHAKRGQQDLSFGTGDHLMANILLPHIQKRVDELEVAGKLTYMDIITEEYFEVACEEGTPTGWPALRKEMVQLAAVLVQAVEAGDRRFPQVQGELPL